MEDVFIARLMSTTPHMVALDMLVEDAVQLILDSNISSAAAADEDNRPEGILATADFVDIVTRNRPKAQTTIERCMTTDAIIAGAQDSILSVAEPMTEHGFRHMPAVDEEEGVIEAVATPDFAAYLSQTGQLVRS